MRMTETLMQTVALTDGRSLRLTVAEPEHSVRGGLVVLHEGHGVTDTVRELVSSLATEGWLTVAPHLFHDDVPDVTTLDADAILDDLDAACVWLSEREVTADRIGVMGFDLGATVAMVVAAKRSVGAVVSVSGGGIREPVSAGLPALLDVAGDLSCPWLGIYGDRDEAIGVDEVEQLKSVAATSEVANDVVRFSTLNHRFDTDPDAAGEAWNRALNWFDSHLR
jgi:carboxymethylenebutenolidase